MSLCTGRTSIRNGCSLAVLRVHAARDLATSLLGVPRMLLKKTRSAASSRGRLFDSFARHTTYKRFNNELLRSFFDAQEDAV